MIRFVLVDSTSSADSAFFFDSTPLADSTFLTFIANNFYGPLWTSSCASGEMTNKPPLQGARPSGEAR